MWRPVYAGVALKQIQDIVTRRYVLSVDNDGEFRSRASDLGLQPKIQKKKIKIARKKSEKKCRGVEKKKCLGVVRIR